MEWQQVVLLFRHACSLGDVDLESEAHVCIGTVKRCGAVGWVEVRQERRVVCVPVHAEPIVAPKQKPKKKTKKQKQKQKMSRSQANVRIPEHQDTVATINNNDDTAPTVGGDTQLLQQQQRKTIS